MKKTENRFCDLHTHSTASDGTVPPEELIPEACAAGLSAVALCDHNTVAGLERFENAARGTGVLAVPGVEVTAGWRGREVHILGLFIPKEVRPVLTEFLSEIDRCKAQSNRDLIERLAAAGYAIDLDQVRAFSGEATPNRVHVANALVAGGYASSIDEAFHSLLRDGGNFYRSAEKLYAGEVVAVLRALSILPVAAHPLLTLTREETSLFLSEQKERGLVGVETVYPLYSEDDSAYMTELADSLGLLPSGGSDFHGENKPEIAIGRGKGELSVPLHVFETLRAYATEQIQPPLVGTVHPHGTFSRCKYVVVCTFHEGRLLLSRHKNRQTWETQGGHIEPGESPLEAARRELYEESGIRDAELIPICDYCGYRGERYAYGVFFVALAHALGELPASEMAEVRLFNALPSAWALTYPLMTPLLYEEAQKITKKRTGETV